MRLEIEPAALLPRHEPVFPFQIFHFRELRSNDSNNQSPIYLLIDSRPQRSADRGARTLPAIRAPRQFSGLNERRRAVARNLEASASAGGREFADGKARASWIDGRTLPRPIAPAPCNVVLREIALFERLIIAFHSFFLAIAPEPPALGFVAELRGHAHPAKDRSMVAGSGTDRTPSEHRWSNG
jgi:hypothetical protein